MKYILKSKTYSKIKIISKILQSLSRNIIFLFNFNLVFFNGFFLYLEMRLFTKVRSAVYKKNQSKNPYLDSFAFLFLLFSPRIISRFQKKEIKTKIFLIGVCRSVQSFFF